MNTTPHLLIADDDQAIRDVMRTLFQSSGYLVTTVCDGEQALEALAESDFDLLLLDLNMPRLSGLAALREMRQRQIQLPCIVMSGGIEPSLQAEAADLGICALLSKPLSVGKVRSAVKYGLRVACQTRQELECISGNG